MKKKNKIAVILVILLGSLSTWRILHSNRGTLKKELSDFAVKDTSSISKIMMADKTGKKVELLRVKPGVWKVNQKYMARTEAINNLLECIRNVEVRNPVPKSALNYIIKDLASGSTKVEIFQNDQLAKVYFVGGETQDQSGTHMLLQDVETGVNALKPYVTYLPGFQGFLSVRYFTDVNEWKSREIFRYGPGDFKTVTFNSTASPKQSFSVSILDGKKFALKNSDGADIQAFDTARAMQYLTYFANVQYEAVMRQIDPSKKDSILGSGPKFMLKVLQSDGKEKQVKIYLKPPKPGETDTTGKLLKDDMDRMLAIVDDETDFVIIQKFVFGKLLVGIDYFMKQKPVKK